MGKQNDRGAGGQARHVAAKPVDLIRAKRPQSAGFEIHNVDETDEVDARMVEAVPAIAFRALSVAREIGSAVVGGDVVLPRHVEDAVGFHALEDFIGGVELFRLGELSDVASVEH